MISQSLGKPLISIIIPVFNEQGNVQKAYDAVVEQMTSMASEYDFEIVFTDNHSTDDTYARLREIALKDTRVKVVRYTRNYGFNRSLLTGYRLAKGAAAIQLDCDLQDPPTLFPKFLEEWKKGHDVVVGIRGKRDEALWLQSARRFFYRMLNRISEDNLTIDGGDFRLVDRTILDHLRRIHETSPYVRGLVTTLAANQKGIPYERAVRLHDQSKFPTLRLIGLAVDGIVSHSVTPLRLASYTGLVVAISTFILAAFYLIARLVFDQDWPDGFATQVVLILMGICLNAIFLGIIGEYIGRIYQQLRLRPSTVIESSINIETQAQQGMIYGRE